MITPEHIDFIIEKINEGDKYLINSIEKPALMKNDKIVECIIENCISIESYELYKYISGIYFNNNKYFEKFIAALINNAQLSTYAIGYINEEEIKDAIFSLSFTKALKYVDLGFSKYYKEEEIEELDDESLCRIVFSIGIDRSFKIKSRTLFVKAIELQYFALINEERITVDNLSLDDIYHCCKYSDSNGYYHFFNDFNIFKYIDLNNIEINDVDTFIKILEMYNVRNTLVDKNIYISNNELLKNMVEKKVNPFIIANIFDKSLFDQELLNIMYVKYHPANFDRAIEILGFDYDKLKLNISNDTLLKKFNRYFEFYSEHIDANDERYRSEVSIDLADAFLVITELQKQELTEELKMKINILVSNIKMYLRNVNYRVDYTELINMILEGKRSPFVFRSLLNVKIRDQKVINFIVTFGNIYGKVYSHDEVESFISLVPSEIIEKVNKKHIIEIMKLLKDLGADEFTTISLAFKIYMALGYERSVSFLSKDPKKNYGLVNVDTLIEMFSGIDLYDTLFVKKGENYVPLLNDVLINMVFGNSNKVLNTPIRNYLLNNEPRLKELELEKERIMKDPNLSKEEKDEAISKATDRCNKYIKSISNFIKQFSTVYNKWDIIEEEFYKKENKSSLKLKINVGVILEILDYIKGLDIELDPEEDKELIESQVFDYFGVDTQFANGATVDQIKQRAIFLSRKMAKVYQKKFPNIEITEGRYTIKVYGPHDRKILSAGYRSGCCFRPMSFADDSGKDYSLLSYCCTTEYGGGVEIIDNEAGDKDKTVMFSPLLRNGNVLMIHSVETKRDGLDKEAADLLVKFASRVIEESARLGDNIEFVTLTNLHYTNNVNNIGMLPSDKKFYIYDVNGEFNRMYNNLSCDHLLLARKEGKTYDDISYGEVDFSYNFGIEETDVLKHASIEPGVVAEVDELIKMKNEITNLSNEWLKQKRTYGDKVSFELLKEIKDKKKVFISKYSVLLRKYKGQDKLVELSRLFRIIQGKDKDKKYVKTIEDLANYTSVTYSENYCILIGLDNKITVISDKELNNADLYKIDEIKELYGFKEKNDKEDILNAVGEIEGNHEIPNKFVSKEDIEKYINVL